ncbi:dihydroorotate dehydrogenase [bacterium]|nr:dihydroorotate dehydrogenase [bacterium]
MDLSVALGRLSLANPILVASGTFGYAKEAAPFVDLGRLGGIVPKTVTSLPRAGNRPPRIVETASGMLNSIGLDNDGIDHFIEHHVPYLSRQGTRLIANVAGKTEDEFPSLVAKLDLVAGVDAIELNLSCPNVSGGIDFATKPEVTERVIRRCYESTGKPILAKLTPNVTDILSIADAARQGGADAVTLINTLVGTAIDWRKRRPILSNVVGGLSGPAIKPIALRMVMMVARKVAIPIVGVGGISTLDDVMEFLIAGASAVQLGTVNFFDPSSSMRMLDDLPTAVASLGASSVQEVIGTLEWPR